ncbi:MAG: aminodeoxychorismate lyase [Pseudomonadota bacterium]|nr:aminodeoxychorismate lyase [Pseudomonadota bacterium]
MNGALVNGRPSSGVSLHDRGFLYGEGVFETIAVRDARPLNLDRHLARLSRGCERLSIPPPDPGLLSSEAHRLMGDHDRAVLRIMVTGGEGDRGYAPPVARSPNRILMISPWPDRLERFGTRGISVTVCRTRLALNPPLAGIKHLNRLEQVLARSELGGEYQEGIVRDMEGNVVEGTSANLMLISRERLVTPDLSRCGIEGIMRDRILEAASLLGIPVEIRIVPLEEVLGAETLFFTNVVVGMRHVSRVGDRDFDVHPWVEALRATVQRREAGSGMTET